MCVERTQKQKLYDIMQLQLKASHYNNMIYYIIVRAFKTTDSHRRILVRAYRIFFYVLLNKKRVLFGVFTAELGKRKRTNVNNII